MFKKPLIHQSNAVPIRSSARRQLLTAIYEQYPSLLEPKGKARATSDDTEEPDDDSRAKELGRAILPEGVRTATFETSQGVEGTMYFSPEGDPLWFSLGRGSKELIPSLQLLARPQLAPPLPLLQIHSPLPPPLLTGAPLFIPALRNMDRPWLLPDVAEGALVAFVTADDSSSKDMVQYVGVGRMAARGGVRGAWERRMKHLKEGADVDEGKFCDVVCIKGDHLWQIGSQPDMPVFQLPESLQPLAQPPEPAASLKQAPNGADVPVALDQLNINGQASATPGAQLVPLSPKDTANLLTSALLQALTTLPASGLPIPASQLYSAYILPSRPAYIPATQRDDVTIAKSEWKKLAKWMKEVTKDGIIKSKDVKGEITVTHVDKEHPALDGHVSFVTIAEEDAKMAKRAKREAQQAEGGTVSRNGGTSAAVGKGKEMVVEELWRPSGQAVAFWKTAGVDNNGTHPPGLMKSALDSYITARKLVHPSDHGVLLLDGEMGAAVGIKRPEPGQTMPRDEVMRKLRAGVQWLTAVDGVLLKGTLHPISMAVKQRQGRKTVTLVSGLEAFGVNVDDFAEELKKLCAGSASVQPLQGSSPKLNLSEVMVQGTQIKIITEALIARGIPRRWIKEGEGDKKKR